MYGNKIKEVKCFNYLEVMPKKEHTGKENHSLESIIYTNESILAKSTVNSKLRCLKYTLSLCYFIALKHELKRDVKEVIKGGLDH